MGGNDQKIARAYSESRCFFRISVSLFFVFFRSCYIIKSIKKSKTGGAGKRARESLYFSFFDFVFSFSMFPLVLQLYECFGTFICCALALLRRYIVIRA